MAGATAHLCREEGDLKMANVQHPSPGNHADAVTDRSDSPGRSSTVGAIRPFGPLPQVCRAIFPVASRLLDILAKRDRPKAPPRRHPDQPGPAVPKRKRRKKVGS